MLTRGVGATSAVAACAMHAAARARMVLVRRCVAVCGSETSNVSQTSNQRTCTVVRLPLHCLARRLFVFSYALRCSVALRPQNVSHVSHSVHLHSSLGPQLHFARTLVCVDTLGIYAEKSRLKGRLLTAQLSLADQRTLAKGVRDAAPTTCGTPSV